MEIIIYYVVYYLAGLSSTLYLVKIANRGKVNRDDIFACAYFSLFIWPFVAFVLLIKIFESKDSL